MNVFEHYVFIVSIYQNRVISISPKAIPKQAPNKTSKKSLKVVPKKHPKTNLLMNHLESLNTIGNPNHFSPSSHLNTNVTTSLKEIGSLSGNLSGDSFRDIVYNGTRNSLVDRENRKIYALRLQQRLAFSNSFPKQELPDIIRYLCQRFNVHSLDAYGVKGITIHMNSCVISFINLTYLSQFRYNLNIHPYDFAPQIVYCNVVLMKHRNPLHQVSKCLHSVFNPDNHSFQVYAFYKKIRDYQGLQQVTFTLILKVQGLKEINQRKFFTVSSPSQGSPISEAKFYPVDITTVFFRWHKHEGDFLHPFLLSQTQTNRLIQLNIEIQPVYIMTTSDSSSDFPNSFPFLGYLLHINPPPPHHPSSLSHLSGNSSYPQ